MNLVTSECGLSVDAIRRELPETTVGRLLYLYGAVDSTAARLARLARAGAPDGTAVIAEAQAGAPGHATAPRLSPPGVDLHASVLFRRALPARAVPVFAFIAELAVVDAVDALGLHAVIRWPHDVLVDGAKIAGTVVEWATRGAAVDYVILGVDARLTPAPDTVVDRNAFAASYLRALDRWARVYDVRGAAVIYSAWCDREILSGHLVDVRPPAGAGYRGRVLGVDAAGVLVVQDSRGHRHDVKTAEIRLTD
jgi:BirA family biotin operon repressor/biotin-[acetyl-CoA-carboxylase] ligase